MVFNDFCLNRKKMKKREKNVKSVVSPAFLGGGQPYLNLFKPIPILEAEGVIGLNRF